MGAEDWGDPFWRSIEEPDEPVVVVRGILATRPAAYDRYYALFPPPTLAQRFAELLSGFTAFAFSALIHILVLVLLAEFVYIAIPVIEQTVLTAQLYRPSPKADVPSPEPASKKAEEKFERPAEAPKAAEEPKPLRTPPAPVIGTGASDPTAAPVPVGVLENLSEIREADMVHLTGTGVFGDRGEGGRQAAVGRYGGNAASEAAVESGLKWLAAHQLESGQWSTMRFNQTCPRGEECGSRGGPTGFDHGVTGLALLAFLGAGNTHKQGPYQATVDRGIRWLIRRQDPQGFFFDSARELHPAGGMYGHGVCTFALGEACSLTRDEELFRVLEKATSASAASQQPNGGWYYGIDPRERKSEFTLSVWHMMGLQAAAKSGVPIPEGVVARVKKFVGDSTDLKGGVYYYPGSNVTLGATGAGLFARCMFGMTEGDWIEKGLAYLESTPDTDPEIGRQQRWEYLYSWYYRTLVTFQVQGRRWRDWNRKLRPFLVVTQRTRGHSAGSWPIIDYEQAGPVYSTAMCVLMLETYYRYLPMATDRSAIQAVAEAAEAGPDALTGEEVRRIEMLKVPLPEEAQVRKQRERDEARARLKSAKTEDRFLGARKLAELGDKESVRSMIAAAEMEFGRLRAAHVSYVGKLKCDEAIPFLMRMLDDPVEDVRGAAVSALMNTTGVYIVDPARWKDWYADHRKKAAPK